MKTKIHVVGAGFAGLTLALKLSEKGHAVSIYEKSDRWGGLLGTEKTPHGLAEKAANALIRSESSVALFESLGVPQSVPLASAKKRFIFRQGRPKTWPLSILESLLFAAKVLPRLLLKGKDGLKPFAQETLEAWGNRVLGKAPTSFILEPAMQGIYGNPLKGLSASLILGALFKKRKKAKARYGGLLTGPGGMQDLVDHLKGRLEARGVQIQLQCDVNLKDLNGPIVIATSATAAGHLLEPLYPEPASLLKQIPMSSLMTVTLFFKQAQENFRGFGCLIPRGYGLQTLGLLMNSYIFKDRDQTYNETWILGGLDQQDLLKKSDAEILKLIAQERFQILQRKDELLDYRMSRWNSALPYYGLELEEILKKIDSLATPDIFLHGNYLGGIGLTKILDRSAELAEKISRKYG